MNDKTEFQSIIVEFQHRQNIFEIDLKSNTSEWIQKIEPENRFIKFIELKIYAVPSILSEDMKAALQAKDVSVFPHVGNIDGYYLPFENIRAARLNAETLCEKLSADLAFTASSIAAYCKENDEYRQYVQFVPDTFYLNKLEIFEKYLNSGMTERILNELPFLIKQHLGIELGFITYYLLASNHPDKKTALLDPLVKAGFLEFKKSGLMVNELG